LASIFSLKITGFDSGFSSFNGICPAMFEFAVGGALIAVISLDFKGSFGSALSYPLISNLGTS